MRSVRFPPSGFENKELTRNKLYFDCFLGSEMVLGIFGPQEIEESGHSGIAEFENSVISEFGNSGIPELGIIWIFVELFGFSLNYLDSSLKYLSFQ